MRSTLALLLLLGAAYFPIHSGSSRAAEDNPSSKESANRTDLDKIQGAWTLSSVELDGRVLPGPLGKEEIVLAKDGKVLFKTPTAERSGTFVLGDDKNPKTMDLTLSKGKEKVVWSVLYEIEEDTMKWGFSSDWGKGSRPKSFKDGKLIVVHLKRQRS